MSMAEQLDHGLEPKKSKKPRFFAVIGGIPFRTKADVRKYYSGVLNSYDDGHTLDGADFVFINSLLKRHRSYLEKLGVGIERFYITRHQTYFTKHLEFERVDGTTDNFSINYCLGNVSDEAYARTNFLCAARTTVLPDIRAFKNASGMVCAITGAQHEREDLHVDHAPPNVFSAIVADFLACRGKTPADYDYTDDSAGLSIFVDQAVADDFRTFHNERASLRVIHKSINLSGGTWGI